MAIKQIFLDLETTGMNPERHGLYSIGGIIRYTSMYKEFEFKCDIYQEDEIDPGAFENTSVCPEDLSSFPDPHETYKQFVALLAKHVDKFNKSDKLFFLNFAAMFDHNFLRRWFENNADQYYGSWFWHPPIDIATIAMEYLKNKRHTMENFKLATVASMFGITVDEKQAHSSPLYDAKIAMLIYDKIVTEAAIERAQASTRKITEEGGHYKLTDQGDTAAAGRRKRW